RSTRSPGPCWRRAARSASSRSNSPACLDSGPLPLSLTEADVDRLLTPADAIAAVEDSFLRLHAGTIVNVPRYRVGLEGGFLAVMSVGDDGRGPACAQHYTAGTDGIRFVVVLFERGEVRALIEADRLGQL